MATDALLRHILEGRNPVLARDLARWLDRSPRFEAFVAANRDKIRKKLRTAAGEDAGRDVQAELLTAYLMLADRRFEVAFEAYGTGRRGPDFTVTFRTTQRFNVEVTRLREGAGTPQGNGVGGAAGADDRSSARGDQNDVSGTAAAKLSYVLLAKLRQLPPGIPNALVVAAGAVPLGEGGVAAAVRLLKTRADRNDDEFFARRGLESARRFYAHYLRLSGVFVLAEVASQRRAAFWASREARHPLSREAATAALRCLTGP